MGGVESSQEDQEVPDRNVQNSAKDHVWEAPSEKQNPEDGRTNFGDIMQARHSSEPFPEWLLERLSDTEWMTGDPYLRIVLSANANFQRVMSAWYQAEIKVDVVFNNEIKATSGWVHAREKQYDRRVNISCWGKVICVATSRIILSGPQVIEAVESQGIGVAQLFRHFKILPEFYITDAGSRKVSSGEQLWREYVLVGGGIETRIREDYAPNLLKIQKPVSAGLEADTKVQKHASTPHVGDLLKGTRCLNLLETDSTSECHPLQRALLTASGNVVRILTSYHLQPVSVVLLRSGPVAGDGIYEREALLFCKGIAMCRARSRIKLESDIQEKIETGKVDLGCVFRDLNLLPEFDLLKVRVDGIDPPGFGRRYTLTATGVSCEILEEFAEAALGDGTRLTGIPKIFESFDDDMS